MQIVLNRQDFLSVLKRAGSAISPNDMLSVRKAVLIDALNGQAITFGATDGPLGIICQAPGEVKVSGRALLNHRELTTRIDQLPDGHVELTVDPKFKVVIKSSASKRKFTMTGYAPEDFPQLLTERPGTPLYSVEAKILQQASSEVAFAIDKDRTNGAELYPGEDQQFQLVSMGARAMAIATGWFTERFAGGEMLLPRNLLEAVDGIDPKATLTLSMDRANIYVEAPGTLMRASQLQSKLPADFRRVLAGAPQAKRFRVSSEAFLSSVKAVSVAADYVEGTERFIQIDVSCNEGVATVATRKSERAQGEDELSVTEPAAGSFDFHVDGSVLTQALRSFAPAEVDLYYDVVYGQNALFLKNETLSTMMSLIGDVKSK